MEATINVQRMMEVDSLLDLLCLMLSLRLPKRIVMSRKTYLHAGELAIRSLISRMHAHEFLTALLPGLSLGDDIADERELVDMQLTLGSFR